MRLRQIKQARLDGLHVEQDLLSSNLLQRPALDHALSQAKDDDPGCQRRSGDQWRPTRPPCRQSS